MALKKESQILKSAEKGPDCRPAASAQAETAPAQAEPVPDLERMPDSQIPAAEVPGVQAEAASPGVFSPEEVTERMLHKIDEAVRAERDFIFRHAGVPERPAPYLKGLHSVALKQDFQVPEIAIAFLSSVSGGKSSFLNVGICKYPIIPVASTETSTCVVEVRRTGKEADERIEVCALTGDGAALEKTPLRTFRKQVFNQRLFEEMREYADFLIEQEILSVDDYLGFFYDEQGDICLRRDNWRHCMVMLMTILDAYVHQDHQTDENQRRVFREANQKRNALLEELGIPLGRDYGVRLYWSSELIPAHAVLVDLPGTGGTTETAVDRIGHSDLVSSYLSQAASLICLFDETAQMNTETRENLSAFLTVNELKGSSSARVNFVLNKADKIDKDLDDERRADRKLRTTIQNFRENFPYSMEYPVYALSTFDGEYALLDEGISLCNLHHASFEKRAQLRRGQDPTEGSLLNYQRARYERAYPCQMCQGGAFSSQSFPQFISALITDYIARISFLQTMERFQDHLQTLTGIADVIYTQQELLRLSQAYSPQLADTLVRVIEKSMDETIDELNGVVMKLESDMTKEMKLAAGRMDSISKQFTTDYRALSQTINTAIKTKVNSLKKQENGTIPLGTNLLGGNSIGDENARTLYSLSEDIAKINFMPAFRHSFRMLKQEFDRQRKLFADSLDALCGELDAFPDKTAATMRRVFQTSLEEQGLGDVQSYQPAMRAAEETARKLLRTICAQYVGRLRNDAGVLKTLEGTANRIQRDLLDLLSTYTDKDFGSRVISRIETFHLFAANTLNQTNLNQFLTQMYITDFETRMEKMLDRNIAGRQGTGGEVRDSHPKRMMDSIKAFYETNLSPKALERLHMQVQSACTLVDNYIQDERYFEEWGRALTLAAEDLQLFFSARGSHYFAAGDGSAYACVLSMVERYADVGWAKAPIQVFEEQAAKAGRAALQTVDELYARGATV